MIDHTSEILKVTIRMSAVTAAIAILLWSLLPEARTQMSGFLMGLVFSMINGWYLVMKVKQVSQVAAENSGKRAGMGFFVRVALSILAVGIAVKKEQFDLLFTIIGLLYVNTAMIIVGIIVVTKHNMRQEAKGVKKEDA